MFLFDDVIMTNTIIANQAHSFSYKYFYVILTFIQVDFFRSKLQAVNIALDDTISAIEK